MKCTHESTAHRVHRERDYIVSGNVHEQLHFKHRSSCMATRKPYGIYTFPTEAWLTRRKQQLQVHTCIVSQCPNTVLSVQYSAVVLLNCNKFYLAGVRVLNCCTGTINLFYVVGLHFRFSINLKYRVNITRMLLDLSRMNSIPVAVSSSVWYLCDRFKTEVWSKSWRIVSPDWATVRSGSLLGL